MNYHKKKSILENGSLLGVAWKSLALLFLLVMAFPAASQAQVSDLLEEADGIVLVYSNVKLNFSGALETASDEVKGYTAVFPTDIEGSEATVGLWIKGFMLTRTTEEADFSIGKSADVNQTPGVSSDDVYVTAAKLESQLFTVSFLPINTEYFVLFVGVGKRKGELQFYQTAAGGGEEVNTVTFSNTTFKLRLAAALPLSDDSALGFTYTFLAPVSEENFQYRYQGFGLGIIFFF